MAERLIAAVLKTAVGDEPTVGSNPSLSANKNARHEMTGIFYTPFPAVHIGNLPFLTTELQGEIKKGNPFPDYPCVS